MCFTVHCNVETQTQQKRTLIYFMTSFGIYSRVSKICIDQSKLFLVLLSHSLSHRIPCLSNLTDASLLMRVSIRCPNKSYLLL